MAEELSKAEKREVTHNVREHAAVAGELLDRLDGLYDERPDALSRLVEHIDSHMAVLKDSALGQLASASRSRLVDLAPSRLGETALNRQALAATDELRWLCGSMWAEDYAHSVIEHERVDELQRLLDAGSDVDAPTSDGMTLLHHAIDIEVDSAAQTGSPLEAELTTLLVSSGADLNHQWHGKTPQEAATARGHDLAVAVIRAALAADEAGERRMAATKRSRWAFWRQ